MNINKVLVYLSAFCISSVIIYMFYYYTHIDRGDFGVVASANELKFTLINPLKDSISNSNDNLIMTRPVYASPESYLHYNSTYSALSIDSLNEKVVTKFGKHPPLGLPGLKDGDRFDFTYFFKNIHLPVSFTISSEPVKYDGEFIRTLLVSEPGRDVTAIIENDELISLKVAIESGKEEVIWQKMPFRFGMDIPFKPLPTHIQCRLPVMDFFFEKDTLSNLNKLIRQDIKVKTSVNSLQRGKPQGKVLDMNGPFAFLIRKKGEVPFIECVVKNSEVLVHVRGK